MTTLKLSVSQTTFTWPGRPAKKFDRTPFSHRTVQYFLSVLTELLTAKRLNFRIVRLRWFLVNLRIQSGAVRTKPWVSVGFLM